MARATKLRLRIKKVSPPESASLTVYRWLRKSGAPRGNGRALSFEVTPVPSGLATELVFRLPARAGHYYLHFRGDWFDEEGCLDCTQSANWLFHLREKRV